MLRRQPLFIAAQPELVSSGLQPDKHPSLQLLWESASNVQFYSGKVRRRKPSSLIFSLAPTGGSVVRGLAQQRLSNGTRRVRAAQLSIIPGQINTYFWDGVGYTFRTAHIGSVNETSLAPATFIDFTALGDWSVVNSGNEKAFLDKPGISTAQPAQWPALAVQYIKKGPFLLALGTGSRKTGVQWSDSDNWETFTSSPSNLAGELYIDDLDTGIVASVRMGGQIAVFAEDQLAAVSYIGEPYYFGQKVLLDGIGAVGKFSVATDGKNAFGVGRGGVWWTDGNSYRYIDEGFLHDYLQDNVNWEQKSKIIAARNDFRGTYEFYFPTGVNTSINEGWGFDPRTGGWSPLPAVSFMDERKLLNKPIVADANGGVYLLDDDAASGALPLSLFTRPLLLQLQDATGLRDVHTDTRIDEVEILAKAASNVEWQYGVAGEADGTFEWTPWTTLTAKQRTYKLPAIQSGVFHKLAFRSTASNWDLDLQAFMLFGQVEGSKRTTQ